MVRISICVGTHYGEEQIVGKKRMFVAAVVALIGLVALGGPALAAGTVLTATLSGAAEVPGPGDPNGAGGARLRTFPEEQKVCYSITVRNIGPATAAHIHQGGPTVAGPIIKELKAPRDGSSSGCVGMVREKIRQINRNPAGFYVNVHNREFPNGAVRGQLSK
jgi:CHRD domain